MKSRTARLIELNSKLDAIIQFRSNDDDQPGFIRSAAGGAGIVAGAGAAGAGGLYLRGRYVPGPTREGGAGIADTMGKGFEGLKGDFSNLWKGAKGAAKDTADIAKEQGAKVATGAGEAVTHAATGAGNVLNTIGEHAQRTGNFIGKTAGELAKGARTYGALREGEIGAGSALAHGAAFRETMKRIGKGLGELRYSSRLNRLIALNARVDRLITLGK